MRLLLLLSALLAALTGVPGARAAVRPVEAGASASAPAVATVRAVMVARPFAPRRRSLADDQGVRFSIAPHAPLYLSRPRE